MWEPYDDAICKFNTQHKDSFIIVCLKKCETVRLCMHASYAQHRPLFIVQLLAFFPVEQQSEAFRAKSFCE